MTTMSKTITVLTIDDDPAMTDLLSLMLGSHGMNVIAANNSQEGLTLARSANPDMILLDLVKPQRDGWEICRELRKNTTAPIAILSAIDDPHLIANALDAGADDYLTKPVPAGVLVAHINNLTRRAQAEQSPEKPLLRQTGSLNANSLNF